MATLYRDPDNPNWFARFIDADGKRISRSTRTPKKREAREIAADFEAKEREKRKSNSHLPKAFAAVVDAATREAAAGELTLARAEELIRKLHKVANPDFVDVTLAEHLAGWVKRQAPHVSESTLRVYKDMERRIVAALGPKLAASAVGDLKQADIEKAIGKIVKTKVKGSGRTVTAATANLDLRCLRRALRDAVDAGLAKANAAEGIRPLPTDDSTERAPFTTQEVRAMLDHPGTSDEWRGVILIAAHTGLRLGDVIRLGREHLEGSRLVIRPEKTKRSRKTLTVPLTPPCLAWIGEREGAFFPSLKGTKTGTLSTQFTRLMERAGVAREITEAGDVVKRRSFHSLRHSFASWLAEADIHADVRQRLTGHSSAGVHGRYTHHDEALDRAIAALPSF